MKTLTLLVILGRCADAGSSLAAFNAGATERNPLVLSTQPAAFSAQLAAETAVDVLILRRLSVHHPKLARVVGWSLVSASAAVTASNLRTLRTQHERAALAAAPRQTMFCDNVNIHC